MPILALTRLKLKSAKLLPRFVIKSEAAVKQLRVAKGFMAGKTLIEPNLAAWTTTLWDSEENLSAYYVSGAHRNLMPKLDDYVCEAVTSHIEYSQNDLPSWAFSHEQLSTSGKFSTVLKKPSLDHQNHVISFPKITIFTRPIKPKK